MTLKKEILSRFCGETSDGGETSGRGETNGRPLYLPDFTLWYNWHHKKGTLPDQWKDYSLPQIARDMGVPIWLTVRPWRVETPDVEITTTENETERVIRAESSYGILVWRWVIGPDGAWWQADYPVKTTDNLLAAVELAKARSYVLDPTALTRLEAEVGDDGVLAIEIPRRPYADLLHEFLGWGDGLMLLTEPAILEINAILETKLQTFMQEIAQLPGHLIFSPDNLDDQFIPPPVLQEYLADSYRRTADVLHEQDKYLLVHVGGPIKHLLPSLATTGIDGLEGIAGLPQSNASLVTARELIGPEMTLWGGIPQDFLLKTYDEHEFETAVKEILQEITPYNRMIIGVADRVPVEAELSKLEVIPQLIEQILPS
ncbi:uroporphyrinogen decarboxylase family protein [Chloroflexota bacterium]